MPKTVVLLLFVALIAVGCSSESGEAESEVQTARDGDLVEVHYVGTLDDGSQFDSSRERGSPFPFTVGGDVIDGFNVAVRGMEIGEVKTVRMVAEDAYGESDPSLILELPIGEGQEDVSVGDPVTVGNRPAVILEVREEVVVVDANHGLAGEALTFEIQLLAITRPTG